MNFIVHKGVIIILTTKKADEIYNASPIKWGNFYDELKELFVEVKHFNKNGIKDELADVFYFGCCAFYYSTKINIPIPMGLQSANKIQARFDEWRKIFNTYGLQFDKKYLVNGANHLREHKVQSAIQLAKEEQVYTKE